MRKKTFEKYRADVIHDLELFKYSVGFHFVNNDLMNRKEFIKLEKKCFKRTKIAMRKITTEDMKEHNKKD